MLKIAQTTKLGQQPGRLEQTVIARSTAGAPVREVECEGGRDVPGETRVREPVLLVERLAVLDDRLLARAVQLRADAAGHTQAIQILDQTITDVDHRLRETFPGEILASQAL